MTTHELVSNFFKNLETNEDIIAAVEGIIAIIHNQNVIVQEKILQTIELYSINKLPMVLKQVDLIFERFPHWESQIEGFGLTRNYFTEFSHSPKSTDEIPDLSMAMY